MAPWPGTAQCAVMEADPSRLAENVAVGLELEGGLNPGALQNMNPDPLKLHDTVDPCVRLPLSGVHVTVDDVVGATIR